MTLPRSVGEVLDSHVVFELECIDRVYLNMYQPRLMYPQGVVGFFKGHRGMPFASSALMAPMSRDFVASIHRFITERGLDLVSFEKGQRKDDVMQEYLRGHDGSERILFVGRAQEKTRVFQTVKRRNPLTGQSYPWLTMTSALPNHFYFYGFDGDFGPFFVKFCSYFPYTAKVCINGHHWAQRQAAKAGLACVALDNAFAATEDPVRLQRVCDRLSPAVIERFVRKWLARLPHPFTGADRRAGYRYAVSVLQAEFSLTQVLDRPVTGRIFFEQVIRDNLDAGRADKVSLVFARRVIAKGHKPTPGRWRTRVLTDGVVPSLHLDYKHNTIKQYFKEGVALRTEATINDSWDFKIGKALPNLPALRQIGFPANRRLLEVQRISADPISGAATYDDVCRPVTVNGQRVAGLRFDAPSTQAVLSALITMRTLPEGFTNRDLKNALAPLLAVTPDSITPTRMSYQLRRLRLHGLIERIPHTNRYHVTSDGLAAAVFLTRAHARFLATGINETTGQTDSRLRSIISHLEAELDRLALRSGLAA